MYAEAIEVNRNQPGTSRVLVVDDDEEARLTVMFALDMDDLRSIGASSAEDALAQVMADPSAIGAIVLDVVLPGMGGMELLRRLKSSPATAHIPVIMVKGAATLDRDIVNGVQGGASDYLAKPCSPSVLVAKVRSLSTQAQGDRQLREELHAVEEQAQSDPLTGLFNRRHFEARLLEASARASRNEQPFAVLMLDLDAFKAVNDTHGHADGDRFLVHFANTIHAVMRADDVAFRYGGDEFILLLTACDARRAVEVATRLRGWLGASPFRFSDGTDQVIVFSAGAAAANDTAGYSGKGLVNRADAALYRAKASGGDCVER
jgi:two-component system cell cycle response regulator